MMLIGEDQPNTRHTPCFDSLGGGGIVSKNIIEKNIYCCV